MKQLKIVILVWSVLLSVQAFGQREVDDKSSWMDRVYFGGGGGLSGGTNQFGSKYFYFSVSPVVGYMITSQLSAGTAIVYQRTNFPDDNFSYTQYGLMPFVRYNFNELFITAEYNYINLPDLSYNNGVYDDSKRMYRSRMLFGAGYSQPLGGRTRVNAVAMYDVLYQKPSVFLSPWVFRVFFSF